MSTSSSSLVEQIPYCDPSKLFAFFSDQPAAVFLDSAKTDKNLGRYSFIAVDPFLELSSKNGQIKLGSENLSADPFEVLQQQLRKYPLNTHPDLPPFQGGAAGYFAYDLCHHLEKLPRTQQDEMQFADLMLGFYDVVFAFDHELNSAWIFSSGYPEMDLSLRKKRAQDRSQFFLNKMTDFFSTQEKISNNHHDAINTTANFTKTAYEQAVQTVIDYIHAGDIFQANISQRFLATMPADLDPLILYGELRAINPAPFAAYIKFGETILLSASPERFLQLSNGCVETRPIKGTRRHGCTATEDEQLKTELLTSEKDRAENIMIVDLMRNDLSRVCADHSVQVTQLCGLESFSTVHHLVSVVTGNLKSNYNAVDLLRATFPGGSVTGAPKVRAMEIIAEIEPTVRGPYCGSIGYIGFDGTMDLSITIRTLALKNKLITFQAGGGIVADSDPVLEYEETLTKASALQKLLRNNNDF